MLRLLLTCLVSIGLLNGCVSVPQSMDEIFSRQVMFTVSGQLDKTNFGSLKSTTPVDNSFDTERVVSDIIQRYKLKKVAHWSVKPLGLEAIVAEFKNSTDIEEVLSQLRDDIRIQSVQPMKTYTLLNYNDPYFHLQNAVEGDDLEKIHELTTGNGVVVGIVDTGVDRTHPELASKIVYSANFVDYDQYEFDNDEHGTSIAGVIGSAVNNDLGIVGIAPDSRLMLFKSCSQDDQTRKAFCDSFSLLKALVDVLEQAPDILNLSLAGPEDKLLTSLIKAALEKGIIVIAAVDNQNPENTFPASIPGVLAVNSVRQLSAGLMPKNGVIAPGIEVLTTAPHATYAFRSGSSMSAAYVSGIAALMKERNPDLSNVELIAHLHRSAQGWKNSFPLVDLCVAVSRRSDGDLCAAKGVVMRASLPH